VANGRDSNLQRVLGWGCWSPVERFGVEEGWQSHPLEAGVFDVSYHGRVLGRITWGLSGEHNRMNALAAIAAARHAGVPPEVALSALCRFENVKRRLEVRGTVNGITIYDDFAHHPTAIASTLAGLRDKVAHARILAVLEPRSNTMKLGVMKAALPDSLAAADRVFCYAAGLGWDAGAVFAPMDSKASVHEDLDELTEAIAREAKTGDQILIMSNGGFGGIHDKLLARLARV
jgi:UDP-N-acetylmuramate: L-alanyl-gamma-D-glutamyl-meso-diaminopimelate ligase